MYTAQAQTPKGVISSFGRKGTNYIIFASSEISRSFIGDEV